MPKKQMKKNSQGKAAKRPAKKPLKNSPAQKKASKKLRKSIARKVVRKAVAKRAMKAPKKRVESMKKKPSKKSTTRNPAAKKPARKPSPKKTPKPGGTAPKGKLARKGSPKKPSKKTIQKSMGKKAKAPKPKLKEKKAPVPSPQKELDRAEISRLLSDAYARHLIIEAGGEHGLEIVRGFSNNSSDEEISKKMKIKISDVRATLNKLHSLGIVEYTRHKDSETGWFSYFWCLNVDRMKGWVNSRMEEERKNFDFSKGEYYFCPNCGGASIHEFVSASDFGFKCPTCSSALDFLSEEKAEELFPMKAFRKPHL